MVEYEQGPLVVLVMFDPSPLPSYSPDSRNTLPDRCGPVTGLLGNPSEITDAWHRWQFADQ